MNALTEHQPWASLQAHGLQTVETRSWRPPRRAVGQRLAIHAGKTVIEDPRETGWETWNAARELYGDGWPASVPTGAVIATATLKAALLVRSRDPGGRTVTAWRDGDPAQEETVRIEPHGNFAPGRWLWVLEDVRRLDPPVPARGAPGMWRWEPERAEPGEKR